MLVGKQEQAMPYFNLWPKDDVSADSYWVSASSDTEARLLLSLNVDEAADAQDPGKFDCVINDAKKLPREFIYRRLHGPVPIMIRHSNA